MKGLSTAAARRVRLLGLDVDGVLTDNGVFIEALLRARDEWSEVLARYFTEQTTGAA
jgi:3-deoxy-D-manno-octulosonate 8-phosphate phosphatase KdsC-like HAD superfamily phosphatase